jgi:hypothetical protein
VYANQTPEATEALPPLVTMVVDAIVFQSVTTFCACRRTVENRAAVRSRTANRSYSTGCGTTPILY